MMPWRTAERPKVASSLATRRSQQSVICRPPPRHGPWIAATVATGIDSIFASATSQRRNQSAPSRSPASAVRSMPVQKARPRPRDDDGARLPVARGERRGAVEIVDRVVVGGVQLLGTRELEPTDAVRRRRVLSVGGALGDGHGDSQGRDPSHRARLRPDGGGDAPAPDLDRCRTHGSAARVRRAGASAPAACSPRLRASRRGARGRAAAPGRSQGAAAAACRAASSRASPARRPATCSSTRCSRTSPT